MDCWTIESTGDHSYLASIEGDLDLANGRDLVRNLGPLLTVPGNRIELDLSRVEFIDSSGLQALLIAHRLAVGSTCQMVLVALSANVERLLDLTGCADRFDIDGRDAPPRVESKERAYPS